MLFVSLQRSGRPTGLVLPGTDTGPRNSGQSARASVQANASRRRTNSTAQYIRLCSLCLLLLNSGSMFALIMVAGCYDSQPQVNISGYLSIPDWMRD